MVKKSIIFCSIIITLITSILSVMAAENSAFGDVNGDGRITSTDSAFIERHALGSYKIPIENTKYADLNGDGKITSTDSAILLRYILGVITGLPYIQSTPTPYQETRSISSITPSSNSVTVDIKETLILPSGLSGDSYYGVTVWEVLSDGTNGTAINVQRFDGVFPHTISVTVNNLKSGTNYKCQLKYNTSLIGEIYSFKTTGTMITPTITYSGTQSISKITPTSNGVIVDIKETKILPSGISGDSYYGVTIWEVLSDGTSGPEITVKRFDGVYPHTISITINNLKSNTNYKCQMNISNSLIGEIYPFKTLGEVITKGEIN